MNVNKFPVGAATAAHQVEGNNIYNDTWVEENLPHSLYDEPSLNAVDHYHCFREDIRLLASAGMNCYRFSIEWSRIQPEPDAWVEAEVEHYREVLKCCHENSILPIVTLLHFTTPKWIITQGGWENPQVIDKFAAFCRRITEELGDLMSIVCTINEANMRMQIAEIMAALGKGSAAKDSDIQAGIHFADDDVEIFKHGNRSLVNILLVVALVLLLSALFNYINLTVAQIGNRAKEMATRRLLGESVGGVMFRYLKESALFTAVCFLLGLLISWAFIPLFNSMLDTKIDLFHSFDLLWFLPLAYVIISIFAGILPAIVVSRFNPIDVVKGTIRMRNKMWFSKIFIVAQNVISITLVVMAITMMLQMKHLADLPLGYQTKDIVSIISSLDGSPEKMSILKNRLKALPEVEEATYGNANPIRSWGNGVHDDNEKQIGMLRMFMVDSTAMKMLGVRVIEQYCEPAYGKIWVTEDAKRAYGVSAHKPWFGMRMKDGKHEYEVCGVIADYHSGDALSENEKTEHNAIGVITPQQRGWTVLVKTRGDHAQALQAIRSTCKQVAKELMGVPAEMQVEYMDDTLKNNLKDKHNMMVLIITFMSISILISALGLFGMSVYYGNQQKRQIALRKVMGASIGDAAWQLAKRFLVSSLVAVVIAIPICVKLMQTYLMDFVHRISFPWWVLLAGAVFTLLIAFVSVIGCTLRTAMSNPIDSIKAE